MSSGSPPPPSRVAPPVQSPLSHSSYLSSRDCILLILVGLPARGKSYVANKLSLFLNWRGVQTRVFNVGSLRRTASPNSGGASFFDAHNTAAANKREELAIEVLQSALGWLANDDGHAVAILDATNSTRARRAHLLRVVSEHPAWAGGGVPLPSCVFIELTCDDPAVLSRNEEQKVLNSPDFVGMPFEVGLADLRARIARYKEVYETMDEAQEDAAATAFTGSGVSYIRLENLQSKIVCRYIFGSVLTTVVSYLLVLHVGPRPIWLVRAGLCSDDAVRGLLSTAPVAAHAAVLAALSSGGGGSSQPTPALSAGLLLNAEGRAFAARLAAFILRRTCGGGGKHLRSRDSVRFSGSGARSGEERYSKVTSMREEEEAAHGVVLVSSTLRGAQVGHYKTGGGFAPGPIPVPSPEGGGGDALVWNDPPLVFTSTLPRTVATAGVLAESVPVTSVSALNPLETGICLGVPLQHLKNVFPAEYEKWAAAPDRVHARVSGGESLMDVVTRLSPLVVEVERSRRPVLIVGHVSSLQVLLAYLRGTPLVDAPDVAVPMHTLFEFVSTGYGFTERQYEFRPV